MLRFRPARWIGRAEPEEVEYAAIIDLQANAVVGVEMQRLGSRLAK